MKKLFFLLAILATTFTVTNAQTDTCKCPSKVKKFHQTPKAKGNLTYVEVNDNDTTGVSFHQELTINTGKDSDGGDSENSGSSAWPWIVGIAILVAGGVLVAYALKRRPRAIHEFTDNQTIREIGNNGGWFTHSRKGEKITFSVNPPTETTEKLRKMNEAPAQSNTR